MLILPFIPSVPRYSMTVPIEGVNYNFDVRWNTEAGSWYFDLRESDETPIVIGVRIVLGAYLGRRSAHSLMINGVFVAVDTSTSTSSLARDATLDDLGTRVQVLYCVNDEIHANVIAMNEAVRNGDLSRE